MTAIITYYNKEERTAIIGCDSLSFSHGKNEKCDKGFYLFNRFYIAVYGPDLLSYTIRILKIQEGYDNFDKPKNIQELCDLLFKVYKITVNKFINTASEEYKSPLKQVAALIFDENENIFEYVDFGHPFLKNQNLVICRRENDEGIQKFAIFETNDLEDDINIKDFLENPKEIINNQFNELNNCIKHSSGGMEIGELGSYYEFGNGKRILESTFKNLDEIIPLIEWTN